MAVAAPEPARFPARTLPSCYSTPEVAVRSLWTLRAEGWRCPDCCSFFPLQLPFYTLEIDYPWNPGDSTRAICKFCIWEVCLAGALQGAILGENANSFPFLFFSLVFLRIISVLSGMWPRG